MANRKKAIQKNIKKNKEIKKHEDKNKEKVIKVLQIVACILFVIVTYLVLIKTALVSL